MRAIHLVFLAAMAASPVLAQQPSPVVERAAVEAKAILAREDLIRELGAMGAIDYAARTTFLRARKDASPADREALDKVWADHYKAIDHRNTQRLKVLLADRGWFTDDEVGSRAASAAFSVVSHADDLAFQKDVLAKMEPLVAAGKAPNGYANLYDRVALQEKRSQRYGTEGTGCAGGKHAVPSDLEAPAGVDQRRATLGLEPMSAYLASLDKMYGRCDGPAT
ncbi:DUF6624 domain-containing protein [Caulobacter sp.]|uniref:DUF6624 domain-containing protein n=1 Tax=Caulobacter sp. TaxID=78 RepID=UPI001B0093F9|nr:DUF6624 domain-containing protein [Caulobacter sp.]MBO9547585.1 hypothetical protein [Caulobacter sp.]